MAAILDEDEIPLLTDAVALAPRAAAPYAPRSDLPRRLHEVVATIAGCALAIGAIFLLLR